MMRYEILKESKKSSIGLTFAIHQTARNEVIQETSQKPSFNQDVAVMLVLNRKAGERVLVGSNIEVVVVEVCGDQVKLGFECPRDIPVLRDELQWHSIPQQAMRTAGTDETKHSNADPPP